MIESVGIFAVLYPKPGREDEVRAPYCSRI